MKNNFLSKLAMACLSFLLVLLVLAPQDIYAKASDYKICLKIKDISTSECRVLVDLYKSTKGQNWTDNTGWLVNYYADNWYGVVVKNGHVTGLLLGSNNLVGEAYNLEKLTYLEVLEFAYDDLTINFDSWSTLSRLKAITLENIAAYGDLSSLSALTNLTQIDLAHTFAAGDLSSLRENAYTDLNFSGTAIKGDLSSLSSFLNLEFLYIYSNENITGDLSSLKDLVNLEQLNLWGTKVSGEISSLNNLVNLFNLNLSSNRDIYGIFPSDFANLQKLEILNLYATNVEGELPLSLNPNYGNDSYPGLSNLNKLSIAETNLCIPNDESFKDWMGSIDLDVNVEDYLCVDEAESFCDMVIDVSKEECEVLSKLYEKTNGDRWDDNSGWLEDLEVENWEGISLWDNRVRSINLYYNDLSGTIPEELGQLDGLVTLHLSGNDLTGEIPVELGQLDNLESLHLDVNALTGEIPAELGQLGGLKSLILSYNDLTGEIPVELGQLGGLKSLYLIGNELTGEIPIEFGQLSSLVYLHLESNNLTGEIPAELGQLNNLTTIDLFNNQLSGELPAELGQLSSLTDLHLESNNLTGEIPAEFGQLENLEYIHLDDNQLSGELPAELGGLDRLMQLYLVGNQFSGPLPLSLNPNYGDDSYPGLSNLNALTIAETNLCIPNDESFKDWIASIGHDVNPTDYYCN